MINTQLKFECKFPWFQSCCIHQESHTFFKFQVHLDLEGQTGGLDLDLEGQDQGHQFSNHLIHLDAQ